MTDTPHRLSEPTFRKYEPLIRKVVADFPKAVPFTPALFGVSSDTLSHRLRDAIKAGLLYGYKTSVGPRYKEVGPHIVVRVWTDGTVVAGGAAETRQGAEPTVPQATNRPLVVSPSRDRLRQLFELLTEGVIPEFRVSGVDRSVLTLYEAEFDVAISQEGDTWLIV